MKTFISSMVALAVVASASSGIAQTKQSKNKTESRSEETIVIRKNGGEKTTVEIKDGEVYVNGDKVTKGLANEEKHKKIIIEHGKGGSSSMDFIDEQFDDDIPRKAMLGVYTKINEEDKGAEIESVMPNTAADKAGLRKGDLITKVDGKDIKDGKMLTEMIAGHEAGDKVNITYERNGKTLNTEASLSSAPKSYVTARTYKLPRHFEESDMPNMMASPFVLDITNEAMDAAPKLGVTAEEMADGNGVRIVDVKPGSTAAKAGLRNEDVIKSLGGETVLSLGDLQDALRSAKRNEDVKLKYERNGKTATTNIVFPKATRKKDL